MGSNILCYLLRYSKDKLFLLARGDRNDIQEKISNLTNAQSLRRVEIINGDIIYKNLGIEKNVIHSLFKKIDQVYHCAAITGFRLPLKNARLVNVSGTRNVMDFAKNCRKLNKVHYISTTFLLGNRKHVLRERDLDIGQGFNNSYEESKFEAEVLVNRYRKYGLNVYIYRPSIIVGHSKTGRIANFKLFFETLKLFSVGIYKKIPVDLKVEHNLIPVDIAARAICIISQRESKGETYHIINKENILCFDFMEAAARYFGYENPRWVSPEKFSFSEFTPVQHHLIAPFLPYFQYRGGFAAERTCEILEKYNFVQPAPRVDFFNKMFEYCEKVGFIKRKIYA